MAHWLRQYVGNDSTEITNKELDEFNELTEFEIFLDEDEYEYNGNHVITKNALEWAIAAEGMCCGVVREYVNLSDGETVIFYAFDYGH